MSWPMLCPNPQSAPISVALMLLLPIVSGVRACAQHRTIASAHLKLEPTFFGTTTREGMQAKPVDH